MKKAIKYLLLLMLMTGSVFAQEQVITVTNPEGKTVQVALSALNHVIVKAVGHDKKEHAYSGVPLSDILIKAGIILGDAGKKQNASRYIVVKARDNYKSSYAFAEIDPLFSSKIIIVADKVDGKPLSSEDAPFQMIVRDDRIHARWIRQIISIDIKDTF